MTSQSWLNKKMVCKKKTKSLVRRRKKSAQISFEFLVTYGWALAVIGIVVAAIYSFGLLDFQRYLPSECSFFGQTGCKDFYISQENFNISVVNNYGISLIINNITFLGEKEVLCNRYESGSGRVIWPAGNTESLSLDLTEPSCDQQAIETTLLKGRKVETNIHISFYSNKTCPVCWDNPSSCPSECIHKTKGRIYGVVNE
ncbi:MAG: hypothetical protein ACQER9_04250 [Nanobdellota archaeon]